MINYTEVQKRKEIISDLWYTRVISKVFGLDILDNNIVHSLYIVKRTSFTNFNESVADMTSL